MENNETNVIEELFKSQLGVDEMDKEKVIDNLESISVCCKNRKNIKAYDEIDREMYADWEEIIENALELLKELETEIESRIK